MSNDRRREAAELSGASRWTAAKIAQRGCVHGNGQPWAVDTQRWRVSEGYGLMRGYARMRRQSVSGQPYA